MASRFWTSRFDGLQVEYNVYLALDPFLPVAVFLKSLLGYLRRSPCTECVFLSSTQHIGLIDLSEHGLQESFEDLSYPETIHPFPPAPHRKAKTVRTQYTIVELSSSSCIVLYCRRLSHSILFSLASYSSLPAYTLPSL